MADRVAITCAGLAKAFGPVRAVDGADLAVEGGAITALLGPSGCGKTTLLRLIAGFERPDAGEVRIGGELVANARRSLAPDRRRIGMVFQDYALFPHLSVAGNVAYPLGRRADRRRVAELLDLVGLGDLADRRPHELSGGQQQRVALARALAPEPLAVLLDEPFSNLDGTLRRQVRGDVRRILHDAGATALLVTHDQEEALSLADRVAVMRSGRIEQLGTPEEVYDAPATRWVAEFLGDVDVLTGIAGDGAVVHRLGESTAPADVRGPVDVLVRPESVAIGAHAGRGEGAPGVVVDREYYGHDQLVAVRLEDGTVVRCRRTGFPAWHPGDRVRVWLEGPVVVLPAAAPVAETALA